MLFELDEPVSSEDDESDDEEVDEEDDDEELEVLVDVALQALFFNLEDLLVLWDFAWCLR